MKKYNRNLGDFGECAAAEYLKSEGYEILARNFRAAHGEIDIVARDGGFLVFVEVKTRSSEKYGFPSEAVDYNKRKHMRLAAEEYYRANPTDLEIRFDVTEVSAAIGGGVPHLFGINHIKGADI